MLQQILHPHLLTFLLVSLSVAASPVEAQELPFDADVPLHGVTSYSEAIPLPEDVIGHRIGTRHTEALQVVMYFQAVDQVSDRIVVNEHARSHQGRPLIHAIVTSPQNHARLEEIRQANLRLSDAPGEVSDAELQDMPVVVYAGYSIHGDEASGTEAALLLLYHLAAGQGEAIDAILENTVIILDPMFNPDGRDRFAQWVNDNRGTVHTTDGQDREHSQPWPRGRTNHYLFDLNRDWMPLVHPESQGRVAVYHHWRPQLLTDHHEMGGNATFFFQPGVPERTNPYTPQVNQDLTLRLAEYHAEILDEMGQLFYTREGFDDFYYGKGSTYPDVQGTVGILFEQASSRALESDTDNGPLHYSTTIRNQFAASLSSLKGAVEMREDFLRYQRDFYAQVPERYNQSETKAYVIGLDGDRTRAQQLAALLQKHRVEVYELARQFEQDGQTFRPGEAYIIPLNQQQHQFLRGVMDRVTEFEDSLFYDVSTWTLPLAYGVNHADVRSNPSNLIGERIEEVELDGGELIGGRPQVAYVMEWGRYFAPRALYRLQDAGVKTRLMHEPSTIVVNGQEQEVGRGAIVIPVTQPDVEAADVHRLVQEIIEKDHVRVYAANTGLNPSQPDLGTRSASVLEKPRVALISGQRASIGNTGEVWHLLNERYDMPVSLLDGNRIENADLSQYNTIVMAGGFYSGLNRNVLEHWIREGGTLIAIGSAASWVNRNGTSAVTAREFDLNELLGEYSYADLSSARGAQTVGGSIFEAELDTTHPIAYGYSSRLPFFRNMNTFYDPSDQPGTNVAVYTDEPLLSGYLSSERAELTPGSASIVAQRHGGGRIVFMFDNPNFRAFWHGTNGLFANAIFFGRSF